MALIYLETDGMSLAKWWAKDIF